MGRFHPHSSRRGDERGPWALNILTLNLCLPARPPAGKSTVSKQLQAHGVPVIDLDVLARVAVEPDSYALSALVAHFGPQILQPDTRSLDREKLGRIVFGNEKERKVLNSIVHPAVRRLLAWELVKAWMRGERVCVVDAPLLIEAGLWKMCGAIIVVYWCVSIAARFLSGS